MEQKGKARLGAAVAVALTGAALMFCLFAVGESRYAPLESLPPSYVKTGTGHPDLPEMVDINTASFEKLEALPGLGPAKAVDIIVWREKNGPFRYPEELIELPGFGEKMVKDLLDLIKTGGD